MRYSKQWFNTGLIMDERKFADAVLGFHITREEAMAQTAG